MVTIVEATIIAALAPLLVIGLGWLIRRGYRWKRRIEQSQTRLGRSVYGDEKDSRQQGLSHDVEEQQENIRSIYRRLDDLESDHDEE